MPLPPLAMPDDLWMTTTEALRYARCDRRILYRASRGGRLRAHRLDGRRDYRIRKSEIDRWIVADGRALDDTTLTTR